MNNVNILTKSDTPQGYTYEWLYSLGGPVVVFRDSCAKCPMSLYCINNRPLKELASGGLLLSLSVCPRCWCVFIVLCTDIGKGIQERTYTCARLREGAFTQDYQEKVYKYPSKERVEESLGKYASEHCFEHSVTHIGCAGQYSYVKKSIYNGNCVVYQWNPEHPRNLSKNEREYLADGTGACYRDDSIKVDTNDCVDLMKKGPYGSVIL